MDSGLVRLLIVAALFLLLAGDYGFILDSLNGVFGDPEEEAKPELPAPELALKEAGLSADKQVLNDNVSPTLVVQSTTLNQTTRPGRTAKAQLMATMKDSCLPKLICELNAAPQKDKLTESEKALLAIISETTISTTAEVTSRYHFAAHMGQLISGVDGAGCHNFYPSCPFPGVQVLNMIKSVRLRPPS